MISSLVSKTKLKCVGKVSREALSLQCVVVLSNEFLNSRRQGQTVDMATVYFALDL